MVSRVAEIDEQPAEDAQEVMNDRRYDFGAIAAGAEGPYDGDAMYVIDRTDFNGESRYFFRALGFPNDAYQACRPRAGENWEEHIMSINKDQVKGRVEEVKGAVKEGTGKVLGDKTLEAKGNIQKNFGKVQAKVGDVEKDLKDSAK